MDKEIQVESNFVKPYFIEELGEEGLTAHDIAKALGVNVREVHKKCRRMLASKKPSVFAPVPYGTTVFTGTYREKKIEPFLFVTNAAKAFVAQ